MGLRPRAREELRYKITKIVRALRLAERIVSMRIYVNMVVTSRCFTLSGPITNNLLLPFLTEMVHLPHV